MHLYVVRFIQTVLFALLLCLAATARAAHTQAQLIFADSVAKPGSTVLAGVHLTMEPGWHTYWKNPGEAGMATKIEWQLPPGVTVGEIQWPLPEKIPPADVTTYGYEGDVVLFVPLQLSASVQPGPLEIRAKLSWLECKEVCIPAGANVEATLDIGSETKPSPDAALLQTWKSKLPRTDNLFSFQAYWETSANGDSRPLVIAGYQTAADIQPIEQVEFFPDPNDAYDIEGKTEQLPNSAGFSVRKVVKKFSGDWPKQISGVVVIEGNGIRSGFEINLPINEGARSTEEKTQPLWRMLLYAFLGGLVLNVMPCVLPVIALKILGFINEAGNEPRHVRNLGIVYTLGVLVSFVVLGSIVIGAKAAGHAIGWGFQFSNLRFLIVMTALVVLIALNLFGVFEVTLGGRTMNAAVTLTSRHGAVGAFFNGLLATLLATSCTAPYLAGAIGFAFAQPFRIILLILLTVGFGLALPYLILSCQPAWLKFLPKPGPWMERFKQLMGFPMLAGAVWLYWLASGVLTKSMVLWFGLFLVVLALGAWMWGAFVQRGTRLRVLAGIIALALVGGFGAYAFTRTSDQIQWEKWTPSAVTKAQSEGHPVLVDFTADWCLTCQVNKKVAIEVPSVRAKLRGTGTVTLVGDYTRTPDDITEELGRFKRAGVPLVLVYPGKAGAPPQVLPEVLTPGIMLEALDKAAK